MREHAALILVDYLGRGDILRFSSQTMADSVNSTSHSNGIELSSGIGAHPARKIIALYPIATVGSRTRGGGQVVYADGIANGDRIVAPVQSMGEIVIVEGEQVAGLLEPGYQPPRLAVPADRSLGRSLPRARVKTCGGARRPSMPIRAASPPSRPVPARSRHRRPGRRRHP
jgi:hypothetical protein